MLDSLCIIFYTAYFKWADGSYSPIPQTKNNTWNGIVNGKIFYGELPKYRNYICKLADKELLPEVAYKRRAVLVEN